MRPPDPGEVGYEPWAFVDEQSGTVFEAYYESGDLMSRIVQVSLYQSPTPTGATPNRMRLTAIWNLVCDAVKYVDEDALGNRFHALQRVVEDPPNYDPDSKGLFGFVRFRLLYFRA